MNGMKIGYNQLSKVMGFEDLQKHGSVDAVRKAGKYRLEKREYIVQDGDIIIFRFNK
jgi:ribosome-binding ATPase